MQRVTDHQQQIGRPDIIVKIDEAKLKRKNNKGCVVTGNGFSEE